MITRSSTSRRSPAARRWGSPFALLTLALLAGACQSGDAAKAAPDTAALAAPRVSVGPENVAVVRVDAVQLGPVISGTLEPEQAATVRAELGGSVLSTHAEPGQRVRAGALLARLDDAALGPQRVSAQSAVATAQSGHAIAQRELQRTEALVRAGAVAERQLEQARNAAQMAATQLANARAQLASVEKQLARTAITAPISGIVSQRQVNAGDVATPGMPLFTVVNPASMRLVASVPAEELASVRVGIPVEFSVSGYPDRRFTGRVTRVNPTVDPATRQVQITVTIPNVGSTLVGGLFAQGKAATESRTTTVVPARAINERGPRPELLRVRNGVVERVPVQVGLRDDDLGIVEVLGPVAAGDTVLLGSALGLATGTPVTLLRPPGDAPAPTPAITTAPTRP